MIARTHQNSGFFRPVGGLFAALALAPWACACAPPAERPAARPPAIQLTDVTLRHYSAGSEPRIVHAETVIYNRESAEIAAWTIAADVPPTEELGRGGVRLEAEEGKGDVHGQRAEAIGKLQVITGAGDRGETVGSVWDASTGFIEGSHPLAVRGPGYAVDANAYRFHVEDQTLQLDGGVHVVSESSPKIESRQGNQKEGEP